ncbi:plasmid mobilization protein [Desulfovibrio desulfuricans]|uniref:plasmid mobilization protein n=1 Tax=Desulfovibrio desulfuricans TaxID=876 RepID=UPI001C01059B|nr:hypothetical protein [Desulfovibrio desulfuricans]MBT9749215.1 hypothetical protein [Desulfovibrio desulfuricans]
MAVKKTETFKLRFTEAELSTAKEKAAAAGLSLAALIRAQLAGAEIVAKVDVKAVNVLSKLGGLCNHLYNVGADEKTTSRVWAALERAANRISK